MTISHSLLLAHCEKIKKESNFKKSALIHTNLTMRLYLTNPYFYKYTLKEARFCIILAICCLVFGNQVSSLSEVKALCARYGISGHNRIIAILDFFRISGRVLIKRIPENRRKLCVEPTSKALYELEKVMECVFTPLKTLYPHCLADIWRMDNESFRAAFYFRVGESLSQGLLYDTIFPEAMEFIDKDAGRPFLLLVYQIACNHRFGVPLECFKGLASQLQVSRSHFNMLTNQGINKGYFIEEEGALKFTPTFYKFVEHYIALYLAWGYLFLPETELPEHC